MRESKSKKYFSVGMINEDEKRKKLLKNIKKTCAFRKKNQI